MFRLLLELIILPFKLILLPIKFADTITLMIFKIIFFPFKLIAKLFGLDK